MKLGVQYRAAVALCALTLAAQIAQAADQVMLVLDASGSMWGRLDGRSKMDIAKQALKDLLADWPADREVGLVVYGHSSKGDCNDIETVVPVGPLDATTLGQRVDGLVPKGMTPLSAAVKQAAEALKFTERKATVVLLSDGKETCDLDPCALGAELEKLGVDFTAHVIGFDVAKLEDQKGLRCLAQATGGRFIAATDAAELNQALSETAKVSQPVAPPPPRPAPPPLPMVELVAPDSALKGTLVKVEPKGEEGHTGYVYLFPKGRDRDLGFGGVKPAPMGGYRPVEIRLPAQPGPYVLKWIGDDKRVYTERPLAVVESDVRLSVPESATAGTLLKVGLEAPGGLDGYVYLYPKGRTQDLGFCGARPARTGGYQPCELRLPADPGDYDLKWLSGRKELLAQAALALVPAEAGLAVPESAVAGTLLRVGIRASEGLAGYVRLFAKGKDIVIVEARVYPDAVGGYKPVELRLPTQPGDFTLKWVSDRKEVLAESPLRIDGAEVSLEVPASAPKGTQIEVLPRGPDGLTGHVRLVSQGKDKAIEAAVIRQAKQGGYQPARLRLPAVPGDYRVLWAAENRAPLVDVPIRVTEAAIVIDAPERAPVGGELSVALKAPDGLDGRLCLFAQGKTPPVTCGLVREDRIAGYVPVRLKLPAQAGTLVLRWLSGRNEVLAERPLTVVEPDGGDPGR
ncbi:VWA domain-containing protein [uncultured Thiodictyon sp.]|uniref:vWA domain-containing protein n=1 Tax=uncultured Thiodictyon sp. TaxID=1846217 RepID=UPI0025E35384|nr:VWA domain-containing protein [uncultured Thiodictyon sp.]